MHKEPPEEYGVPGTWQPAGDRSLKAAATDPVAAGFSLRPLAGEATWIVPPDFSLDDPVIRHWLFDLGDWRFYIAPGPVAGKSPDVFRCSAAELLAWMSANSVLALIESFHDDTAWVVALGTA